MSDFSSLAPTVRKPALNLAEAMRLLIKYDYNEAHRHKSHYSYGTAGFRYLATEMCPIVLRVGLAAAVLSIHCQVGVMITASHNTAEYNGVKLAGADGGMIDSAFEELVVYVVNERNLEKLMQFLREKLQFSGIERSTDVATALASIVHIGRDTREHSVSLSCLVCKAAVAMGCCVVDHGVVTTPMLHHAVKHANGMLPLIIPPRFNTAGYYDLLVHSYIALLATKEDTTPPQQLLEPVLTVDCACGVGYPHLKALIERLEQTGLGNKRKIVATNAPGSGPLNDACGSEFVQKELMVCKWYEGNDDLNQEYCASLDGDADRIVFFSTVNNKFTLLDGDKISVLIGNFLQDQLNAILQACDAAAAAALPVVKLGVVQTAYANGASTGYLQAKEVLTCITKTGVKHVHAAAHDHFDIGVYFEANGHGTVLFGDRYYDFLFAAVKAVPSNNKHALLALQRLRVLPSLVNQAVGDALSDLLLVDAILQLQGWSIGHWAQALYQDLPSRQVKVKVADRTVIVTNDNETECYAPATVQAELNRAVADREKGRAFVRPSGTEDVVRIYAEAATPQQADALAAKAAEIVFRLCGGVEEAPSLSRM